MKKLRIYIDTSVISGCCDSEFAIWSNGLLKDFQEANLIPVLSNIVAAELEKAPNEVLLKYSAFLSCNPEFVEIDNESSELADEYLKRQILSKNFIDDALHIALSTVSNVDVLVSWNFKHIVHFDKIRLFNAVNIEFGYKPLQIYSPREVTNYDNTSR